jgi:protein SCO1/2
VADLRHLLALALVLPALAACTTAEEGPVSHLRINNPDGLHGIALPTPYDVPSGDLTDTSGEPFDVSTDLDAPLTLVFFGYTNCPDICQIVMSDLTAARLRLPEEDRADVDVLIITSDPERDTPEVLREYLDRFDPDFEGLTGSLPEIVDVAEALGVFIEEGERLTSGGYTVEHGGQIVGLTPDGEAPYVWTYGTSSAELAGDLRTILEENRS